MATISKHLLSMLLFSSVLHRLHCSKKHESILSCIGCICKHNVSLTEHYETLKQVRSGQREESQHDAALFLTPHVLLSLFLALSLLVAARGALAALLVVRLQHRRRYLFPKCFLKMSLEVRTVWNLSSDSFNYCCYHAGKCNASFH